jgi:hypothetical protein
MTQSRIRVHRALYDELKAILTNAMRHGPSTQNRSGHQDYRSHLLGFSARPVRTAMSAILLLFD